MSDDAYSFYCKKKTWERCKSSNLIVVKTLIDKYDEEGNCTEKEVIYKCAVCGGFYKRQYDATFYDYRYFDNGGDGWSITDKCFKIEQPLWFGIGSSGKPPLTLEEARFYGYAGKNHTWKNNRCNFPAQNVELTCRAIDLSFVAYRSPESKTHISDRFFKCRRCGEWYFFKLLQPYTEALLKPSNEIFPVEEARKFGYDETEFNIKKDFEALNSNFKTREELPPLDEWLKENRSETEKAEYASLIVKKHFIRVGLQAEKYLDGVYGWLKFSQFLKLNIDEIVKKGEHSAMLKNMLAELKDFYEAATGESLAYYLFTSLESHFDGDAFYRRIEPFLPAENLQTPDDLRQRREKDFREGKKLPAYK